MAYFDASPDILCLFRLTADDRLVYEDVNRATERAFQVVRAEVLGRGPAEVVDAATAASLERPAARMLPQRRHPALRGVAQRSAATGWQVGVHAGADRRCQGEADRIVLLCGTRRDRGSAARRRRCGRRRRWRRWASSPAASRTTSTTC